MIARMWQGWAAPENANAYEEHYRTEVAEHLSAVPGFLGARLLKRQDGGEVHFTSITLFENLDTVRGFAGDGYEAAVVEDAARAALVRWDEHVSHHDVAVEIAAPAQLSP
jgi:antibiotic biosynthesis monooxygenase (ABM) superfamily enzyme